MKKISDFLSHNRSAIYIGLFCFGVYMYFTLAGNRICDCETTEKYRNPATTGISRTSRASHFYHK